VELLRKIFAASAILGAASLLGAGLCTAAPTNAVPEFKLKASFIYNFAKLTHWPQDAFPNRTSPLKIAVMGNDHLSHFLEEAVTNRTINNRPLVVLHLKRPSEATNCHLLYISQSEKDEFPGILSKIKDQPVLTVSDIDQFAVSGGMIGLSQDRGELRFSINQRIAAESRLKFSSKLLNLAISPDEKERQP
jgi:hypothetical protein